MLLVKLLEALSLKDIYQRHLYYVNKIKIRDIFNPTFFLVPYDNPKMMGDSCILFILHIFLEIKVRTWEGKHNVLVAGRWNMVII